MATSPLPGSVCVATPPVRVTAYTLRFMRVLVRLGKGGVEGGGEEGLGGSEGL